MEYFKTLNINSFTALHALIDTFKNIKGEVNLKEVSKHDE